MDVSTPASDAAAAAAPPAGSPPRRKLPTPASAQLPSTPTSALRRNMASNAPSSGSKDAVPPRRPTAAASGSARRLATATSSASNPLASATSRASIAGSSLNKPPTRPVPGTTVRRTGLAAKAASSDAEPELSSVTSGEENRKPTVRRTPVVPGTATRSSPGKSTSRQSIIPSTATAAKRPLTTRPPAEASTSRATPRASLASSTKSSTRPAATAIRAAPGATPKAPGHAKKLSIPPPPPPAVRDTQDTEDEVDVSLRSNGPLKDKAASDAELEVRKTGVGQVKAALAKLGEEPPRPDTAPSGPAEMDFEQKRRSVQIMQDFFKETTLREKLQEQCDDLNREVDNLQSEKTKLRKQLVDAQAAIAEKDKAIAVAGPYTQSDQTAHTTLVHDMEQKFAQETKQLEEQSQQLQVEKQAAQEKSALQATHAAELQQVLDDLNSELEQQGAQWDAEKKKLVEQAAQIDQLTKAVATLREERDSLSRELDSAQETLEGLQTKLADLERTQTDSLHQRDQQIETLTQTVEHLRSDVTAATEKHADALQEAQQSLESKSSESSAAVEGLMSQITSLQQQHTDDLRLKEDTIASHVKAQKELQNNIAKLQKRADQASVDIQIERNLHAENIQKKIDDLQKSSSDELRLREEEVSNLLKSIDGLQEQVRALEQGSTDGAKVAETLHKQIEELKQSHEASLNIMADQNNELAQQLDAINDQLSTDATEAEELRDEIKGLRKTINSLEQVSHKEASQHAADAAKIQNELSDAKKKVDTYKSELDATQDRHRQDLRVLGEDYESEIESLRADLEGDAKHRLEKLQAEFDSLVAEKNTTLEKHERVLGERAESFETLQKELATLKENSGSASHQLEDALKKHKEVEEEKKALADAHATSQNLVVDLQARVDALTKDVGSIDDLQAQLKATLEQKDIAEDSHKKSQTIIADLQARHDSLLSDKTAAEDAHSRAIEALKEDSESKLKQLLGDLQSKHDALLEEKSSAEAAHTREIENVKTDMEGSISALQTKHDALLGERDDLHSAHKTEIESLHKQRDTLSQQLSDLDKTRVDSIAEQLAAQMSHDKALIAQRGEIEQKYATLLEELQNDATRLEQEKTTALLDKQTALNELVALKKDVHAEIAELKAEVGSKEKSSSASLAEVTSKYDTLLAEKAAAETEHEDAVMFLKDSLKEDHERAISDLQSRYDTIQQKLAKTDQEHGDAIELLKEEFKAGHSNDVQALQQQLDTVQKTHMDLVEQKASMDQAHEEAISELMVGMEASSSEAVQQLQKKYEALATQLEEAQAGHVAALEAARSSHATELEATKQDVSEQQTLYRDLLSRHDKATANVDAHAEDVKRLMQTIHEVETERDEAAQAAEDAESRIEIMKGEVVRKHLARVEPLEKANAVLSDKVDRLEAIIAAGDRVARAAASMGEKRNINSLVEEDEDEDTTSGVQQPKVNGAPTDIAGTLAAMQETLNQLAELNSDVIIESSRTAQKLTALQD